MKVKEKLVNLFETMDNKAGITDIFNFVDSALLDKYYFNMFGNREMTTIANDLSIDDLAQILNNMFISKWNNIILNYLDSEKILDNYKEVTQEVNVDKIINETIRVDTTKVSAYNDDDFINKDEDSSIDTTTIDNNRDKNITRTKIKEIDLYEKVNNYLTNFNIYNTMVIDINSIVTLNILN